MLNDFESTRFSLFIISEGFLRGSRKVPASVVTFRPVKVIVYLLKLGHPERGPFTAFLKFNRDTL